MTAPEMTAWLVANLPTIAPWAGLAAVVIGVVGKARYWFTYGAPEYARGYRAGEKYVERLRAELDAD